MDEPISSPTPAAAVTATPVSSDPVLIDAGTAERDVVIVEQMSMWDDGAGS